MTWDYIPAEKFCDSVRDGTHDTPKPVESGFQLVTGKHIHDGRIDPSDAYYISEKDYNSINQRSKVERWDVLMSMIGNGLGRSAVVVDTPDYAIKNIALFKVGDEIKAKWLHYFLSSKEGQGLIYNSLQGSGQPFISLSYIRDFLIPNPPYKIMEKVVRVLEQYDLLIDNNQKQIKLLEEAAQRLYKEWFVDFRFPGHETTPIINGLPLGWEMGKLGQLVEFKRGQMITKDLVQNGNIPVVAGGLEPAYYHNIANTKAPVITVSGSGANAGYTRMYHVDVFASDCSFADSNSTSFLAYAYCFLIEKKNDLRHMQKGSAQPHVYAKDINTLPILLPEANPLKQFCDITSKMHEKVGILEKQNTYLIQARSSLLPKLISDKIEVKK